MDGLAEPVARTETELCRSAASIDHADVTDEIELLDREARDAEPERERQDRLCHRVWNRYGLAAQLGQHGRQRDLAGTERGTRPSSLSTAEMGTSPGPVML